LSLGQRKARRRAFFPGLSIRTGSGAGKRIQSRAPTNRGRKHAEEVTMSDEPTPGWDGLLHRIELLEQRLDRLESRLEPQAPPLFSARTTHEFEPDDIVEPDDVVEAIPVVRPVPAAPTAIMPSPRPPAPRPVVAAP